jgi:hypothetical protein
MTKGGPASFPRLSKRSGREANNRTTEAKPAKRLVVNNIARLLRIFRNCYSGVNFRLVLDKW